MDWQRLRAIIGLDRSEPEEPTPGSSASPTSRIRRRFRGVGPLSLATGDDPAFVALRPAETHYLDQRTLLEARFEEQGIGIYVAAFVLAKGPDGRPFSYCLWTQNVISLLPESDLVLLSGVQSRSGQQWEFFVSWEALSRLTQRECLVQEPGLTPARWRTVMWPNSATLEALRAAAQRF
jgi:hypothetical protein